MAAGCRNRSQFFSGSRWLPVALTTSTVAERGRDPVRRREIWERNCEIFKGGGPSYLYLVSSQSNGPKRIQSNDSDQN